MNQQLYNFCWDILRMTKIIRSSDLAMLLKNSIFEYRNKNVHPSFYMAINRTEVRTTPEGTRFTLTNSEKRHYETDLSRR